jgi:hypothetical protein
MSRRRHLTLTVLAAAGAVVSLYQCWYVSLPLEQAATFDLCRLTPALDCFRSLHAFGGDLRALGMPVLPLVAVLFLYQAALCGFAWVVDGARRESWPALACLVSFPLSGLALFVILNDVVVVGASSLSAVLVAIASLAISTTAVLAGLRGVRLTAGGRGAAPLAVAAALAGILLSGAVTSRRTVDLLLRERQMAPPGLRWSTFAHDLPRAGAATLGRPRAPAEVVLIVDPADGRSQDLMRQAAELMPRHEGEVLLTIYAPGESGARLVLARREGTLDAFLRGKAAPAGDPAPLRPLVEWQEEQWRALGVDPADLPVAIWRTGREQGAVHLPRVLEAAKASVR